MSNISIFENVLISGCSFSSDDHSGWSSEHMHKHYPNILRRKTGWNIDNIAIGGCSNNEILLRTTEHCIKNKPDLCIIQWSSLHRFWVYESNNNIDEATRILPSVCGRNSQNKNANLLHKILIANYLNNYVDLKHWLEYQILLQSFLKSENIPYIFLKGFNNYIAELEFIVSQYPFNNIPDIKIPQSIRDMLHFDQNPDYVLLDKLLTLVELYIKIDKNNCLGYNCNDTEYGLDYNFRDHNDYADDGRHPGEKTNLLLADKILQHLTGLQ